ncbi:MAG: hypothetical protein WKF75_17800 [Singulisphaera sp.]
MALALVVVVPERAWVTQGERIALVVEDLRRAVEASDVEGVTRHLTSDVQYLQGDRTVGNAKTRAFIRSTLRTPGSTSCGSAARRRPPSRNVRRGTAEFRVMAKGSLKTQVGTAPIGSAGPEWSLGFQETSPDV